MPFDVQECIKLHNSIVSHACTHLPPENQPIVQRSWFQAHSLDNSLTDVEAEFDDDLRAFLSGIDIVVANGNHHLAFTPVLIGVTSPDEMQPNVWEGFDEYEDLVLLYKGTGYDPGGLVYSKTTQQVCFVEDAFDDPHDYMWGDLHVVLELYSSLIKSGKFVVDTQNPGFGDGDNFVTQGWRIAGCTDEEMTQCLDVWSSLIDAISARLPKDRDPAENGPLAKKRKVEDYALIHSDVLAKYPAIPPFARAFLARAKKPSFASIAPQLDVPDEDFISRVGAQLQDRYPTANFNSSQHEAIDCPLFLLFPWRIPGVKFISQDDRNRWERGRLPHILDDRCGLYITPDDFHANACDLLLPFQLGSKSNVLRMDGTKVDRPTQNALYQHDMCHPFLPWHGTPLVAILDNWLELIEKNHWEVDAMGVAGDPTLWKKADTEAHSEDFQPGWDCA
jgi:hypothetical protein